ncbi:MAG: squalene/phytoene synthase family protein [Chthoniobacterales bacterium]|nr:squalene/phytoene synthase family protein [Chthoniobacterales bacterium]
MKAILKSVARSFYLTIRFLPRPLREPVGLAYLLARATDTIADTAEIPATLRLTTLHSLGQVVAGKAEPATIAGELRDFAAKQRNQSEKTLIENLPGCLDYIARTQPADREDIRAVLATIVRGQSLDLERFGPPNETTSLQNAAELEEYTYLVAGCVGEFWTKLGFRDAPPFANRPPNEMIALGVAYGQGLQLLNILRDRGADLTQGRGYLPADDLAHAPEAEVFARWLDRAEAGISAGIEYCAALTNWRVRFATALPALIGGRTIALLRVAGAAERKVKVPRREVRRILAGGLLASASPIALHALYDRLRAGRDEKAAA